MRKVDELMALADALARKMLAVAKGESPAVTALAGKLVSDIVVFAHEAQKMTHTKRRRT